MMAGAWKINKKAQVKAYCDNHGVVVGFKKMVKAIGRGGDGRAPVYKHSVDLWEEIEHWCRLWKQQFVLEWAKGHPEDRGPSRDSWTLVDWMNHVAQSSGCGVWASRW